MDDKSFVWTHELNKKMFQLRFENDLLFRANRQPWREFHQILRENGFPKEMTVDHVRKKWSYTYDMYKHAKKSNNKSWPYYKLFDKNFGQIKVLDKYESWNDEWRLKLIICISEAKEAKLDFLTMWKTVERAMRIQDLPIDCCIQDMSALWHHLRTTFNRKHRLKLNKGDDDSDWPLYDAMYTYYEKFEPEYFTNLENEPACVAGNKVKASKHSKNNKSIQDNNENESEFQWSKDITETFIQIRLQNDWLFRQKKRAWNELMKMMIQEYGFPKTLTARELGRKWAATMSQYQKSKATNNTSWVYHTLFELYLGESRLSLNPLVDWQEEWVFNLISSRTDLDHLFRTFRDQKRGWREVEKRLRSIGLPLEHSLLDLPEIWAHLLKTFKWKQKFSKKGILTEHSPYFEGMTRYSEIQEKQVIKKQKVEDSSDHFADVTNDDDYEDDLKLFELKQRLGDTVKPKYEVNDSDQCRSCSGLTACVDIFENLDDEGLDVAYKLKVIAGVEVEKSDTLPSHMCLICLQELESAFKFRRKCQDVDKQLRSTEHHVIKVEDLEKHEEQAHDDTKDEQDDDVGDDMDISFDPDQETSVRVVPKKVVKPKLNKERTMVRKKGRKPNYYCWKVCEVCGKHTRDLHNHLDTHKNDKSYSCNLCDKKFKFKSSLTLHKYVHDPTPRKTCQVCGKTFNILSQYRKHFVYHANERKYGCETCGKRFNTIDILKVHSRTHTDERPFSCQECGKTFRTAGCVSRHRRIVHRNIKNIKKVK